MGKYEDWDFLAAFLAADGESVNDLLDDAEEAYLGNYNTGLEE